jgi:hypothetical protein
VKRFFTVYHVMGKTFHRRISPVFTGIGLLILHCIVSIGIALDRLFFPALRKISIRKPIVIVGNPRSGTTFLQRFLVSHGLGAGMRIWKMIFPSLVLQRLIQPLLPFLERYSPARGHHAIVHKTDLGAIETDDPAIFFRYVDGLFLYGFFLTLAREDLRPLFDPNVRDTTERDFTWLETIWKRNLVSEGQERVIAKVFSLGMQIPRFLLRFPDAKILYMVRDPLHTVPSGLSLVTGVLEARFGFWDLPGETRKRYITRLYHAFLELSMRFLEDYIHGRIPEKNIMIVPYQRMMQDFDTLMDEILAFIGVEATPDLRKSIKETAEKQRGYQSRHAYNLAKFGLDEERILTDYAPIYEKLLKGR